MFLRAGRLAFAALLYLTSQYAVAEPDEASRVTVWRGLPAAWMRWEEGGLLLRLEEGGVLGVHDPALDCRLQELRIAKSDGGGLMLEAAAPKPSAGCRLQIGDALEGRSHVLLRGPNDVLERLRLYFRRDRATSILDNGWKPLPDQRAERWRIDDQYRHRSLGAGQIPVFADGERDPRNEELAPTLLRAWMPSAPRKRVVNEVVMARLPAAAMQGGASAWPTEDFDDRHGIESCERNALVAHPRLTQVSPQSATSQLSASAWMSAYRLRPAINDSRWHHEAMAGTSHSTELIDLYAAWIRELHSGTSYYEAPWRQARGSVRSQAWEEHLRKRTHSHEINMRSEQALRWAMLSPLDGTERPLRQRAFDAVALAEEARPSPSRFALLSAGGIITAYPDSLPSGEVFRLRLVPSELPLGPVSFDVRRGSSSQRVLLHPAVFEDVARQPSRDEQLAVASRSSSEAPMAVSLEWNLPGNGPLIIERIDPGAPHWVQIQQRVGRRRTMDAESLNVLMHGMDARERLSSLFKDYRGSDVDRLEADVMLRPLREWLLERQPRAARASPDDALWKRVIAQLDDGGPFGFSDALRVLLRMDLPARDVIAQEHDPEGQLEMASDDGKEGGKPERHMDIAPFSAPGATVMIADTADGRRGTRRFFLATAGLASEWRLRPGARYTISARWPIGMALGRLMIQGSGEARYMPLLLKSTERVWIDPLTGGGFHASQDQSFVWQGEAGLVRVQPLSGEVRIAIRAIDDDETHARVATIGIGKRVHAIAMRDCTVDRRLQKTMTRVAVPTQAPALAKGQAQGRWTDQGAVVRGGDSDKVGTWIWLQPVRSNGYRDVHGVMAQPVSTASQRFDLSTTAQPLVVNLSAPSLLRISRVGASAMRVELLHREQSGLFAIPPASGEEEQLLRVEYLQDTGPSLPASEPAASSSAPKPSTMLMLTPAWITSVDEPNPRISRAAERTWSAGWRRQRRFEDEDEESGASFDEWRISHRRHASGSRLWWRSDLTLGDAGSGFGWPIGFTQFLDHEPALSGWRATYQASIWSQQAPAQRVNGWNVSAEWSKRYEFDHLHRWEPYLRAGLRGGNASVGDIAAGLDPRVATRYALDHPERLQLGLRYGHRAWVDAEWGFEPWLRLNPIGVSSLLDHAGLRLRGSVFLAGSVWRAQLEHRRNFADDARLTATRSNTVSLSGEGFLVATTNGWWRWQASYERRLDGGEAGLQVGLRYDWHSGRRLQDFRPRELAFRDLYERHPGTAIDQSGQGDAD